MPARVYDAGGVIYGQGGSSDHVFNLISGWIALHRDLADGRRQITRFLVAGAMFGVEPAGEELGHAATALTNATVCPIPTTKLDELRRQFPSLNERFILMLNRDNRRAYEALTTLGQGSAKERIAHLLGELAAAASDPNPIHAGRVIKIPLTQRHIAEATGLTSIHVNRILRQLREDQVIDFHYGSLLITDRGKLQALAEPGLDRAWPTPDNGLAGHPFSDAFHVARSSVSDPLAKAC